MKSIRPFHVRTFRSTLAIALATALASNAHAAVFQIAGTFDSATSPGALSYLLPSGTAATANFNHATAVNTPVALESSWLDIQGNSIVAGSLNVGDYAVKVMPTGGDNYGAALEYVDVTHTFGGGGFTTAGSGGVPGSCKGGWTDACTGAYAGTTSVGYVLSSTGANTYHLVLNFKGNVGQNISHSYSLVATPEVPVPAAGWLFGSALLGVVGAARRKLRVH